MTIVKRSRDPHQESAGTRHGPCGAQTTKNPSPLAALKEAFTQSGITGASFENPTRITDDAFPERLLKVASARRELVVQEAGC
jgi:hypothetical protein